MTKMEDEVTPEALRPHRAPSDASLHAPPLPPASFNPPAESPPDPSMTVSPPISAKASPHSSASIVQDLIGSPDLAPPGPASPASGIPRRPDLKLVQRLSDDVILSSPGTGSQDSASGSQAGSEGGEHLQEMRERLVSESSSASSSRRDSESSTPKTPMDIHVTVPTPPTSSADDRRQLPNSPEAGPSRLKASLLATNVPQLQSPDASPPASNAPEHQWDSVWPASVAPRPLGHERDIPPFSPAPVSPFVTPTFSAPAPLVSRRPISPNLAPGSPNMRRAGSPVRYSPRAGPVAPDSSPSAALGRSPPHSATTRHSRTQSSGSTLMRPPLDLARPLSPPLSPPSPSEMLASTSKQRINDSLSRRADPQSPPFRARTTSSGTGPRPRRTSFGDVQSMRVIPESRAKRSPTAQPVVEDDIPPLPPTAGSSFALPPPVAAAPIPVTPVETVRDDPAPPPVLSPPLVAPLARPATLRRALSDYDSHQRPPPTQFHRTLSVTTELERSPRSAEAKADADTQHPPRPVEDPRPPSEATATREQSAREVPILPDLDTPAVSEEAAALNLVDEGDILPTGDYQMDVTFDDEGLNTLERIFLLSQSDFGFHRAYVARVLGDLLEDVDPCESVEYVLPLLNGYSVDEDETVKEAFSSELHRILWYFFSTCRLTSEPIETVTITSEGLESVPKPTLDELPDIPVFDAGRRGSIMSTAGPSSAGSSLTNKKSSLFDSSDADTPNSVTSVNSDQTAFSPLPWVDANIAEDSAKEPAQLVAQPELAVGTFTPLLGNLMLSHNPVVGDHTRDAVIAVIARLRGTLDEEKWVRLVGDQDKRKTYSSQNGLHAHDLRPFSKDARSKVETELLNGIVLGMGRLSIELPDSYLEPELDEEGHPVRELIDGEDEDRPLSEDAEAFKLQLIQEADAGRAISLFLIGSLCDVYDGQEVVQRGFLDEVLRSPDGDETTRTEAAVALSRMAKIIPDKQVQRLIDIFTIFVNDVNSESVQQAVAVALPVLAKRINESAARRTFAVEGMIALSRSGDNCRCSALEILGELIYLFHEDPLGPPQELLDIYWDDSNDRHVFANDCVWDIIAAYNFPGVCLTLGPDRWPELRGLFHRLQERGGEKVLTTIASFLHEIAKILRPDQVAEDLLPVYTRLIDAKDDIRERVFAHVDDFITGLPAELGWMTFLGLEEAWKCNTLGGWRARELVASHLPALLKLFVPRDVDITPLLDMTLAALTDKFAAVRDAAIRSIPGAYTTLESTRCEVPFREMLLDLSNASSYRQRVTFTRCLREFIKPPPNKKPFEDFFADALPRLRTDVVDVRLALARIVSDLFVQGGYYATDTVIPVVLSQLAQALAEDDAPDVRDAVRHVDIDRLGKGKAPIPPQITETGASSPSPTSTSPQHGQPADGLRSSSQSGRDTDATPRVGKEPEARAALNPFAHSFKEAIQTSPTNTKEE